MKKKAIVFIIVVLLIAVSSLAVSGCLTNKEVANAENETFSSDDTLNIAHITDIHYFPLNYCYSGDIEGTDYETDLITGTKLLSESSLILRQALKNIEVQSPDYLLVTGDNTRNGEIQAHIEVANLLRELQNRIRENGNPDFQIFVTPGNHDMYNAGATYYRNNGKVDKTTHLTTRYDFTKIYSSLGYPDLTDAEIQSYYDSIDSDVYFDNLPYESNFVNSTNSTLIDFEYQYVDTGKVGQADYDNGEISYIAYCPDDYVIAVMDDEISDEVVLHHVGGLIYPNTKTYLSEKQADGKFYGKNIIGAMHHNVVPHFEGEDSLLKDFTVYGWTESTDFFADLGIRYMFTGHMHSNDIATHTSFNGNVIIDIETSSVIGTEGAVRYSKLERGKVGNDYAENYSSKLELVGETDFTSLVTRGYITEEYFELNNLSQYVKKTGGKYICTNPGDYATQKIFLDIVDNITYKYVTPEFIGNLGSFTKNLLGNVSSGSLSSIIKNVTPLVESLINNLIDHLENVVLSEYEGEEKGDVLCEYVNNLLNSLVNIKVNSQGDTLFDFGMNAYLKHVGGTDTDYSSLTDGEKEAFENLKNGVIVKAMFDALLDKNTGLYRVVVGLTQPIDLAKGMSDANAKSLKTLLGLFVTDKNALDVHAVKLDDVVPKALEMANSLLGTSISLDGMKLQEYLDHVLDGYITDSFYTSLGEIAYNILYAFSVDETSNIENRYDDYSTYKYGATLPCTYLSTVAPEEPSVKNGKLPSMLTVTYGENPQTDKNFVWYTDRRVTNTDIQYCEGEFDASKSIKYSGEYTLYATTTANIDLGVYATLMHIEVGYHCVELKGLKAGTTYSYRVGSSKDGFWSDVFSFTTAPSEDTPFEILLITDIQGSALATYNKSAEIMSKVESVFENGYDFVVNCGDVVDNSRNLVQWRYFLDGDMQQYWANTTQVVANGNHDKYYYEPSSKIQYSLSLPDAVNDEYNYLLKHYKLNYPTQDDKTGAYYSFDYSGVHFTVLNTNNLDENNLMAEEQVEWLKNDLQSTDKKFKVVLMHKGLYSSGSHTYEADVVAMRSQLAPIFTDNGVHLVLAGHDHTYTESYYLDREGNVLQTSATGKSLVGEAGTLYITLGTFGDKFYNYEDNSLVPVEYGADLHSPVLSNPTFGKLVYDGENLYYYGYEYDLQTGEILDIRKDGGDWWVSVVIAGSVALGVCLIIAIVPSAIHNKKSKAKK